jgi:hypothetical protein
MQYFTECFNVRISCWIAKPSLKCRTALSCQEECYGMFCGRLVCRCIYSSLHIATDHSSYFYIWFDVSRMDLPSELAAGSHFVEHLVRAPCCQHSKHLAPEHSTRRISTRDWRLKASYKSLKIWLTIQFSSVTVFAVPSECVALFAFICIPAGLYLEFSLSIIATYWIDSAPN